MFWVGARLRTGWLGGQSAPGRCNGLGFTRRRTARGSGRRCVGRQGPSEFNLT